jgi:hypothetical protein
MYAFWLLIIKTDDKDKNLFSNNSEQVRRSLAIGEKLRLEELSELYEKKYKVREILNQD